MAFGIENALKGFGTWFGIFASKESSSEAAHRNMIIIVVGSLIVAAFAGMLVACLATDIPCPINGFEEVVSGDHAKAMRFLGTSSVILVIMLLMFVYAFRYLKKKKDSPIVSLFIAFVFSFSTVVLWGMAESGLSIERQVLIFASIQFLTAGLIVFTPIVSLIYFVFSFSMFAMMLGIYAGSDSVMVGDLVYLALLDMFVSWIVYSLHKRGVSRERRIADKSRRDELTGAKNRHYLRDDFDTLFGSELYVMFCDIDDFKHYNDSFSHEVGDELLRQFYYALREAFGDECTYRYGGDEFLVISPDFSETEFKGKLKKCSVQLARHADKEPEMEGLTFSGGYVHGTISDEKEFRSLLHKADERLMEGKRLGKNCIVGDEVIKGA